ncbi:unnamed protein product [Brassica napus]|uniref:(rape) hypothetical protein n=1 Tax=Brassica napus TaxID=3708 RepID=A0A816ILL0_BRANA|nr:unnamed protein product [Brassica napus]
MQGLNFISDLKPKKSLWMIKVKVIRLWKKYSADGGRTIEMTFVDEKLYLISSLRFHGDLFHDSSLAFSPSRTDRSIRRGILLRADQTGVSLDTAASGDSKYKKQDDKVMFDMFLCLNIFELMAGRVEDHAKWTTNIVDEKVDMFAFGVLVLEVITSHRAV